MTTPFNYVDSNYFATIKASELSQKHIGQKISVRNCSGTLNYFSAKYTNVELTLVIADGPYYTRPKPAIDEFDMLTAIDNTASQHIEIRIRPNEIITFPDAVLTTESK